MDRVITPRRFSRRLRIAALAAAALLAVAAAALFINRSSNSITLPLSRVSIAPVTAGTFDDYIPLRARVTPSLTVYLDAVEGGRIDRLLVEDGATVKRGQPLAILSNATLQLDVIAREADVSQQLNNLRTQELALERSRLENRRNLSEVDWQARKLARQLERDRALAAQGWVSKKALADSQDEYDYYTRRRTLTLESLATEERLQGSQLAQLRTSGAQLLANLRLARASLDALTIRAPVDGLLSGFSIQVGQSLDRGERLGQVDSAGRHKLVADIDEYWLGRVQVGQPVTLDDGTRLAVAKLYPQVKNGSFTADLRFTGAEPARLQRGQTLPARLTLGDPSRALLLPAGAFLTDGNGSFAFVLDSADSAVRRPIRLGRRNADQVEVLGGLAPGDRVIVSAYTGFADKDRISLEKDQ
ncbi:efflux RND transporter periplasmic adaptor subunit [Sandaracinobacteroides saxicola]|uniref:Efflux RND transporter periplasmic adaptor subunit n=1 Tax=Sandaracinobacteroides saxicola TaxID=2759707 RepID=A0A7G5IML6_9SPHN|nr:efflux RND transporter periplasmic adaptor subunit [Sandaracinobacteroides saxicola]